MDSQPTLCICVVLIFCINLTASEKCENDDLYVIRTYGHHENYALDATDPTKITIREFSASKGQSWRFQQTEKPGSYFIVNEQHGKVLDFELGDDDVSYVILNDKNEKSVQQHWNYVSKSGLIYNFANGKTVHIKSTITSDGSAVIALWDEGGCLCQRWILHKKA